MIQSEQINELSAALIEFHKAVGKIKKDAKNPFFKSSYATLSQILDVINTPLTDNGLNVVQMPSGDGLNTILLHKSGQYIGDSFNLMPVKNDPQAQGSAITYARRYALGAILSLNIDEDDDGNKATEAAPEKQWLNKGTKEWDKAKAYLSAGGTIAEIKRKYRISKSNQEELCQQ